MKRRNPLPAVAVEKGPAPMNATTSSTPEMCVQPSLGLLLRQADRLIQSAIEAGFGTADLNFTQWNALYLIRRAGPMTTGELAASLQIARSAVTRVTGGLEARHLLARKRTAADRRVVTLHLTEVGRTKLDEMWSIAVQRWGEVLAGLATGDVARLIALLDDLAASVERSALVPGSSPVGA